MVEPTHLENMSQNGNLSQIGLENKNMFETTTPKHTKPHQKRPLNFMISSFSFTSPPEKCLPRDNRPREGFIIEFRLGKPRLKRFRRSTSQGGFRGGFDDFDVWCDTSLKEHVEDFNQGICFILLLIHMAKKGKASRF